MGGFGITGASTINCGALTCTSETDTGALTCGGLITANGGLTLSSGQTLTLTGATSVATTQPFGNNSTSLATTAYVSLYTGWNVVSYGNTGGTITLPVQTAMNNLIVYVPTAGAGPGPFFLIQSPPAAYVGQLYRFVTYYSGSAGSNNYLSVQHMTGTAIGWSTAAAAYPTASGKQGLAINATSISYTYVGQPRCEWYIGQT
jgi:hypothetical protein